jgi:membrane protein implicated in regulation of membrane protease activity
MSNRFTAERSARSANSAHWATVTFILLIGSILWVGVLSDSSGRPGMPAVDSVLYVAAVVCVAVLLAYADRKRSGSRKNRKDEGGHKSPQDIVVR